jgi:hypothetical protein
MVEAPECGKNRINKLYPEAFGHIFQQISLFLLQLFPRYLHYPEAFGHSILTNLVISSSIVPEVFAFVHPDRLAYGILLSLPIF